MKKSFNVDSPSFTPTFLSATDNVNANVNVNASINGKKLMGISPKAANAAPFLPKSAAVSSRRVLDCGER
jgi:PAB-dependent poly(A)-specific ribonuclease subunit 3